MPMDEDVVNAALASGEAQGRAAAMLEYETRRARDADAFSARLAQERAAWSADEAERLAETFKAALDAFEQRIAQSVARILTPFVGERVSEQMWMSLGATLDELVSRDEGKPLRISGRDDLVEALRARCEARGLAVECRPSDASEVTIVCDNAVIETRLGEWAAKLRAATEA